jgi:hypothetical protein
VAALDGSASDDPDLGPASLAFAWRFVSVPTGSALTNADLAGADTAQPSFTPDVVGTYVVELRVDDGEVAEFDNVAVQVRVPAPAPIVDLAARAKSTKVDLTWTPSPEAVAYEIHRGISPGGPYTRIADAHETATGVYADFGLTDGVTYYYVVYVIGSDQRLSPASNEASATPSQRAR